MAYRVVDQVGDQPLEQAPVAGGRRARQVRVNGEAEAPRFAVLIRLDGPEKLYGGQVAAPVLKDLAQELLTYYRVPPSP